VENNVSTSGSGGGKSWKQRFHIKQQNFILLASATDETSFPSEPNEDYKQFLESPKAQTLTLAQHNITNQRGGTQAVDNSLTTMLFGVDLINANPDHPKGLSIFFSVPMAVFGSSSAMSSEELAMRQASGNLTSAQIIKLSNSVVQIPVSDNDLQATLKNHLVTVDFVFGKASHVYRQLASLYEALEINKRSLSMGCAKDTSLIPKFMTLIDMKMNIFLSSCAKATNIGQVNFKIFGFQAEIDKILLMEQIMVPLPLAVSQILKGYDDAETGNAKPLGAKREREGRNQDGKANKRNGQQKKEGGGDAPAKNPAPNQAWKIKRDESYSAFHANAKSAPTVGGKGICIKYHILGSCGYGAKCNRKESHTNDLDAPTKKAMDTWVKKCRESKKEA
jgi:hypothetical protein